VIIYAKAQTAKTKANPTVSQRELEKKKKTDENNRCNDMQRRQQRKHDIPKD